MDQSATLALITLMEVRPLRTHVAHHQAMPTTRSVDREGVERFHPVSVGCILCRAYGSAVGRDGCSISLSLMTNLKT